MCDHPLAAAREARGGHPLAYYFLFGHYLCSLEALPLRRERQGVADLSLPLETQGLDNLSRIVSY